MSITFFCPDAPDAPSHHRRVPCDSESEYGLTCTPEERCGYCDDGMMDERVTDCPEANFANENALGVLWLLGMGTESCGALAVEGIPNALQRCLIALSSETTRSTLNRDAYDGPAHDPHVVEDEDGLARISTGPRVICMGNSDEQTIRRVMAVRDLLVWAHEHGHKVCWG